MTTHTAGAAGSTRAQETTHEAGSAQTSGPSETTGSAGSDTSTGLSALYPEPPEDLAALMSGTFGPQKKFKVPKAAWLRRLDAIPEAAQAVESLPGWINRDDAVEAVRQHWPDSVTAAFTSSMVWAYGEKAGYAPYRVLRVLTASRAPEGQDLNARVVDSLERSIEFARAEGAVAGFSYLNDCTHKVRSHQREHADLLVGVDCGRIYGLGPSFFTKWLQIATLALQPASSNAPRKAKQRASVTTRPQAPAPMWDSQMITWLDAIAQTIDHQIFGWQQKGTSDTDEASHLHDDPSPVFSHPDDAGSEGGPSSLFDVDDPAHGWHPVDAWSSGWSPTTPEGDRLRMRLSRTDHYEHYVELLGHWGEPHGLNASQVADRIYRLIRRDGDSRRSAA